MRERERETQTETERAIQSGRKEQRQKQRDREAQQLLMQTNLLLSAVVNSRLSALLHTELQCHSPPMAADMKWQQAQALSQQATAATGKVTTDTATSLLGAASHRKGSTFELTMFSVIAV